MLIILSIMQLSDDQKKNSTNKSDGYITAPGITLPTGGGAVKGIAEKFQVNAVTGTASFSIPLPVSENRNGFTPQLNLSYNSGAGNSSFGLGWDVNVPNICRKTEKKLPKYLDSDESDTFISSGSEDLVAYTNVAGNAWASPKAEVTENGKVFRVKAYRPRVEGLFSRIEKWTEKANLRTHWRCISKDNIHSYYGMDEESCIFDPKDKSRVFQWLLSYTHDDKGNISVYKYRKEDGLNIPQSTGELRRKGNFTNAYLKQVLYGNSVPYYLKDVTGVDTIPDEKDFLFRLVFNYGEHEYEPGGDILAEVYKQKNLWACRKDPFSNCRPGFDKRNYRLCTGVLMFHNFSELGIQPYLVKSLQLEYNSTAKTSAEGLAFDGFSFLSRVTQWGHRFDDTAQKYVSASIPPTDFFYQQHEWQTTLKSINRADAVNLPVGIDNKTYKWVDLYSEGLSGILNEQDNRWYYNTNLGNGTFSPAALVSPAPSVVMGLSQGMVQLQDLEGNGKKYLVSLADEPKGFFELSPEHGWQSFLPFKNLPNVNFKAADAKYIDLDGDGVPDLIINEDSAFCWYEAKGREGYASGISIIKSTDEELGPVFLTSDEHQTIFMADMTGDGLTDLVRIRANSVEYWNNLGFGKFGPKVIMENAPVFDHAESFNPAFIKLADIDGSGTTDIIYLGKDKFRVWLNLSGNKFSPEPVVIDPFFEVNNVNDISVLDLFGEGTSCLVWSSPLPAHAQAPMRYINLMGGKKPHLMVGYTTNMGKRVKFNYASSTKFYLSDKLAGKPWITRLPFPVHCLQQVVTEDLEFVNGEEKPRLVFKQLYSYHHGYYDQAEREFRGFGRVEQTDAETISHYVIEGLNRPERDINQAPVKTVSWYHTGAYFDLKTIHNQFAAEYFKGEHEFALPQPVLPATYTGDECREALRACKGMLLRQEVYALDGTANEKNPYSCTYGNFEIKMLQPMGNNRFAVFFVHESEKVLVSYERDPTDPRIAHTQNLETDGFGNVLQSASLVYGRKKTDPGMPEINAEQQKIHVTYSVNTFTENILNTAAPLSLYRLPVAAETLAYEITGLKPGQGSPGNAPEPARKNFTIKELLDNFALATDVNYEDTADVSKVCRRIVERERKLYMNDALAGALPFKVQAATGLSYESYKMAFTSGLVTALYNKGGVQRVNAAELPGFKYVQADGVNFWMPSGRHVYLRAGETTDAARARFFAPVAVSDAYGAETLIKQDKYSLLVQETEDALHNKTTAAVIDYRLLKPVRQIDSNGNASEVLVDELGLVIATTVYGKELEVQNGAEVKVDKGDKPLVGYRREQPVSLADVVARPNDFLQQATSFFYYDLYAWMNEKKPCCFIGVSRQTHESELPAGSKTKTQLSLGYTSGLGQILQSKIQAEPGLALVWRNGRREEVNTGANFRFIGSGRTLYNNKGKPVLQYEPYYSTTFAWETEKELVEIGYPTILFYDPLDRVIRTVKADGTFKKVQFDAWMQLTFDENDTVGESEWYARLGHPDPLAPEPVDDTERRAAWLTQKYSDKTPAVSHLDTLGRVFYSIEDNGATGKYSTRIVLDIENNQRRVIDALGKTVVEYEYDMLGNKVYQKSMDGGARWTLNDAMGKTIYNWDSKNQKFKTVYDVLHRSVEQWLTPDTAALAPVELKLGLTIYGEAQNRNGANLRGKVFHAFDQSGMLETEAYDIKGNGKSNAKRLALEYKKVIDWNVPDTGVLLQPDNYITSYRYNAFGKLVALVTPDGTEINPGYNDSGLLKNVRSHLSRSDAPYEFVANIDYNAKGQRNRILYGNNTVTAYNYDEKTYRLTRLLTTRNNGADILQDIKYTYDPVGNITDISDDAQQVQFFNNAMVKPHTRYTYDALYRLVKAEGREFAGQNKGSDQLDGDKTMLPAGDQLTLKGDMNAMQRYEQKYEYDAVGNMLHMIHNAGNAGFNNQWTRDFFYNNPANNQLTATEIAQVKTDYAYDVHGNMLNLQQGGFNMQWNFADQLQQVDLTGGGKAFYVYNATGNRVRKVIETGNLVKERIYLGGYELYTETLNDVLTLERETLHVMDDKQRIALVETRTAGSDSGVKDLIRFQYNNHLSTATLELTGDAAPEIISYEEYYPFGSTAYQAVRSQTETSKRYRYTGKERDNETGLYYHGARYYAPWLARWTAADPIGIKDGVNIFIYVHNNPVRFIDPDGKNTMELQNAGPLLAPAAARLAPAAALLPEIAIPVILIVGVTAYFMSQSSGPRAASPRSPSLPPPTMAPSSAELRHRAAAQTRSAEASSRTVTAQPPVYAPPTADTGRPASRPDTRPAPAPVPQAGTLPGPTSVATPLPDIAAEPRANTDAQVEADTSRRRDREYLYRSLRPGAGNGGWVNSPTTGEGATRRGELGARFPSPSKPNKLVDIHPDASGNVAPSFGSPEGLSANLIPGAASDGMVIARIPLDVVRAAGLIVSISPMKGETGRTDHVVIQPGRLMSATLYQQTLNNLGFLWKPVPQASPQGGR